MKSLDDKYVLYSGPESYRTGQIVAMLEGVVLIQFDAMENPDTVPAFPMELVSMEELVSEADGIKLWGFFDTRAKLNAHLAWLERLTIPARVVRMVSNKTPPVVE